MRYANTFAPLLLIAGLVAPARAADSVKTEATIRIARTPEQVWDVLVHPARGMAGGDSGNLVLKQGQTIKLPGSTITVISMTKPSFLQCRMETVPAGGAMVMTWVVRAEPGGTRLDVSVTASGRAAQEQGGKPRHLANLLALEVKAGAEAQYRE